MIRAAARRITATIGRHLDRRRQRCTLCGERRQNITAHLYIDHADGR